MTRFVERALNFLAVAWVLAVLGLSFVGAHRLLAERNAIHAELRSHDAFRAELRSHIAERNAILAELRSCNAERNAILAELRSRDVAILRSLERIERVVVGTESR